MNRAGHPADSEQGSGRCSAASHGDAMEYSDIRRSGITQCQAEMHARAAARALVRRSRRNNYGFYTDTGFHHDRDGGVEINVRVMRTQGNDE